MDATPSSRLSRFSSPRGRDGTTFTYSDDDESCKLVWQWSLQYKLETAVAGSGSVSVPPSWQNPSAVVTNTATPPSACGNSCRP